MPGESRASQGEALIRSQLGQVVAHGITALQIGRANKQIVTHCFRVDNAEPKFDKLGERRVIKALAAYKANPTTSKFRSVDKLVGEEPWLGFAQQSVPDMGQANIKLTKLPADSPTDVFFIENCHGVQLGDGGVQRVIGICIMPPTYDDARLLHDNGELRAALINRMCEIGDPDATDGELRRCVVEAIGGGLRQTAERATPDNSVQVPRGSLAEVRGGYGVTAGKNPRQIHRVEVTVTVGEIDLPDVSALAADQAVRDDGLNVEKDRSILSPAQISKIAQRVAEAVAKASELSAAYEVPTAPDVTKLPPVTSKQAGFLTEVLSPNPVQQADSSIPLPVDLSAVQDCVAPLEPAFRQAPDGAMGREHGASKFSEPVGDLMSGLKESDGGITGSSTAGFGSSKSPRCDFGVCLQRQCLGLKICPYGGRGHQY